MNNKPNTFEAEKLAEVIRAMSSEEKHYILKFIPVEYCMGRIADELQDLKEFRKAIEKTVNKEN